MVQIKRLGPRRPDIGEQDMRNEIAVRDGASLCANAKARSFGTLWMFSAGVSGCVGLRRVSTRGNN